MQFEDNIVIANFKLGNCFFMKKSISSMHGKLWSGVMEEMLICPKKCFQVSK